MGIEQIRQFLQDYDAWSDTPLVPKGPDCKGDAYLYELCCPAHRYALQMKKSFILTALEITRSFPQLTIRPLTSEWFVELAKMTGLPIPGNVKPCLWRCGYD